jgi:hypothetical protein
MTDPLMFLYGLVFGIIVFSALMYVGNRAVRCFKTGAEPTDLPTKLFYQLLMYFVA